MRGLPFTLYKSLGSFIDHTAGSTRQLMAAQTDHVTSSTRSRGPSLIRVWLFAIMELQEIQKAGDLEHTPGQIVITGRREGAT